MALPFSRLLALQYTLPNPVIIPKPGKVNDMI